MDNNIIVALIGVTGSLLVAVVPKLLDKSNKEIIELRQDVKILGDMVYQMLDHMATNNNTNRMKKCLDQYNEYFRHN